MLETSILVDDADDQQARLMRDGNFDDDKHRYFSLEDTGSTIDSLGVDMIGRRNNGLCLFCLDNHDSDECPYSACIGCGSDEHGYKDCE